MSRVSQLCQAQYARLQKRLKKEEQAAAAAAALIEAQQTAPKRRWGAAMQRALTVRDTSASAAAVPGEEEAGGSGGGGAWQRWLNDTYAATRVVLDRRLIGSEWYRVPVACCLAHTHTHTHTHTPHTHTHTHTHRFEMLIAFFIVANTFAMAIDSYKSNAAGRQV